MRENNLIFFNLSEDAIENSKAKDTDLVKSLCGNELNVNSLEILDITRLGKFVASALKDRPLWVTLGNRDIRGSILRNAYKLKNSDLYRKVGIGRDLTNKQREDNKVLRKELDKMKKSLPGKNWGIRRDKIVELPTVPPLVMGDAEMRS
ncbi:hypothetical protein ACF0H5_018290 [Mactra antiquata]